MRILQLNIKYHKITSYSLADMSYFYHKIRSGSALFADIVVVCILVDRFTARRLFISSLIK